MRDRGEIFEHKGYTFRVRYERDECFSEPWKEFDGHGVISEWTSRDKKPCERVLVSDLYGRSKRYYDIAASLKIAKRDSWGCRHSTHDGKTFVSGHKTKGELAACAVECDYEYLRAWCNDEWLYVDVTVEWVEDTDIAISLGGVETWKEYHESVAVELADELLSRIEIDTPDVVLSEN